MVYSNEDFLVFVFLGMFCTMFVQLHQLRSKSMRKFHMAQDAFLCSILTGCVCVPLFEYFPNLPYALCLPIGGAIGTIGFSGWQRFISTLFDLVIDKMLQMVDPSSHGRDRNNKNDKEN